MEQQDRTSGQYLEASMKALAEVEPIYYAEQCEAVLRAFFRSIDMEGTTLGELAEICRWASWRGNPDAERVAPVVAKWRDAVMAVMPL